MSLEGKASGSEASACEEEVPYISVVIPLLNERESLRPLFTKIQSVLEAMGKSYEVVFVDDGSTDASFDVLEEIYQAHKEVVKVVQFRKNYGKSAALSVGFREASGEIIITMDADLQDDPGEVPHLIAKLNEGYDLVSGWKRKRHDPLSKTLPSRIFNKITSWVSGIKIHDFNCGLKAYRREVTEDISVYGELHRYLPVIAHWGGYRIGEIEVVHHPRRFGTSKFGVKRLLNGFLDLLTVTLITRYMTTPLHLFGTLGAAFVVIGTLICLYLVGLKIHYGNIQSRTPLLMLGVLLIILGIQAISTGLLGEMITSIYHRDERVYFIRRKLE